MENAKERENPLKVRRGLNYTSIISNNVHYYILCTIYKRSLSSNPKKTKGQKCFAQKKILDFFFFFAILIEEMDIFILNRTCFSCS